MDNMNNDSIDEIEVRSYEKKDSNIIIKSSKGKKLKIFNSKKNEEKVLEKMEEYIKDEMNLSFVANSDTFKGNTIFFGLLTCIISYITIKNGIDSNASQNAYLAYTISKITLGVDSFAFLFNTFAYSLYKSFEKEQEKFKLFFRNKKLINETIKENVELLDDLKSKSKEEILENISDKKDMPITVNSVNKMKLEELKNMLEKIKFYENNGIETANDIIEKYNGIEELTEKYDSMSEKDIKKAKKMKKRLQL